MNHGKRIRDLLDNGDRSHNRGDVDAAIRAYQEACGLAEAAVERDPEDADAHELLARIQLTLGDWQTQRNDLQAAVKTLKAAESTWEKAAALRYAQTHEGLLRIVPDTGISGLPGADGGPEFERAIADVAIIRAQAHAGLGNLFSALADAQQALFTYIIQAEAGHLASDFDQALIAMAAAEVQMRAGGDPEIIAAAAGYAVYQYAQGFVALEPWERDQARMEHWHDFTMAAEIANVAHLALGQHDRAKAVRQLIEQFGAVRHEWPGADLIRQLRQRPTLPAVLAKVAPELNARLPGLAGASMPLVPVLRVRLESAPDVATELAQLAEAALDRGDIHSGMRLALDAHLLFAATSMLGTNKMRYRFHRYGATWARVLYRAGRQWFDDGNGSDAADASGWLTGVADILFLHAVYDVEIRSLIATWLRWQHELYTSLGDTESVANVARATATLATFDTGGSP